MARATEDWLDGAVDHHRPQVRLWAETGDTSEVCEGDVRDREADEGQKDGAAACRRQSGGYGHGFSRNRTPASDVEVSMDADERAAVVDEGFDPDNPAVMEAMARVREVLAHILPTTTVALAMLRFD